MDQNHKDIVNALRTTGWKVLSLASLGDGCPDLLLCRGYELKLVEVKQPKGKLTEDQERFIVQDGWPVTVLRTVDEALTL